MARRFANLRPGLLLLSWVVATLLWLISHGVSSIERAYDVPVQLQSLSEELVVTEQNPAAINVRIQASQATLRNLDPKSLHYAVDVTGSKPGDSDFEVDVSRISLPRGARIVSRSPSRILLHLEPRGRKAVAVRVDLSGEPATGFVLDSVEVVPNRVWLTGARKQVLRLSEVVTEPVDLSGMKEDAEKEVTLFLPAGDVRMEKQEPVKVVLRITPQRDAVPENVEGEGLDEKLEKS